jgi:hypothetical protein
VLAGGSVNRVLNDGDNARGFLDPGHDAPSVLGTGFAGPPRQGAHAPHQDPFLAGAAVPGAGEGLAAQVLAQEGRRVAGKGHHGHVPMGFPAPQIGFRRGIGVPVADEAAARAGPRGQADRHRQAIGHEPGIGPDGEAPEAGHGREAGESNLGVRVGLGSQARTRARIEER